MVDRSPEASFQASHASVVGRYAYRPDTDEWWWSDAMFRIHGFEAGQVVPTTELVMRHIHPDDVAAAWESRERVVARAEPFSFLHRIRTAQGASRVVLAAGHLQTDDGAPVVHGHLIDVTDMRRDAVSAGVSARVGSAVDDFVGHRAVIEQAKGVLMQLYSIDADTAWAVVLAFSQDTNRKVRDIAEVLVEAAAVDRTPTKTYAGSAHEVLEHLYERPPGRRA